MRLTWGRAVVGVVTLALAGLTLAFPSAMLSPGALAPAHADLSTRCFSCHTPFQGAPGARCITCHRVADIGVRTTRGAPVVSSVAPRPPIAFHQELTEPECAACHGEHRPVAPHPFTHALLRPATRERCDGCHAGPGDELHRDLGVGCARCHETERWTPAGFDHALLGPTALQRCASCHRAPSDAQHPADIGPCAPCHGTQRWKPSTFDHDRSFRLDRDHSTRCTTCHERGFKAYTCYGCHEHTPTNLREEHEEEGIRDFTDCVECHRSADEEQGGHGERAAPPRRGEGREAPRREHDDEDEGR